jgi:RNA polymerase sigma factor (sigma-70 family)
MTATIRQLECLYHERFAVFVATLGAATGDAHLAEECVQAAFARAIASRASFRGGSLAAWVWRIALNGLVDARRRELRVDRHAGPWDALAALPATELRHARDPAVRTALMRLSPRRRLVVFLRYYADLTQPEIAEVLGTTEGTVAATLFQARAALRDALQASDCGGVR